MSRTSAALVTSLSLALLSAGCRPAPSEPEAAAAPEGPISLVADWQDVEIEDPVAVPEDRAAWASTFGGDSEPAWSAVQGIEDLRVEDGALRGTSTSDAPLLLLELPKPAGGGDRLWAVEAKLRVSDGTRWAAHPVPDQGPPLEVHIGRVNEMPISSPILPGDEATTTNVVLDQVFLLEMMPAMVEPQRILFRPTDTAGADFALESLRLVFRQEHFDSIPSGPGWHGLGEVFRETLVSRAPETLAFDVTLPERPWLGLAVGSVEEEPPTFRIEVVDGDNAPQQVAEVRPDEPESWNLERVDLGEWAGKSVRLRLRAEGSDGSENALAFWGAPTIRNSLPADAANESPQTIVLFLADTLRRDHLEVWGHDRETAPTIARLASEGVVFQDAISQSTWTKVSVSSILTSLYPSTTGVAGLHDRIAAGETTLAEALREAGYATFATSSVPFSGQLTNLHQGVEVLHEFGAVPRQEGDYNSKTSRFWIDSFLPWLEMHRDVPVFAFLHAMDPHSPFQPEAPFDTLWATEEEAESFREQADRVRPFVESPLLARFDAPSAEELEQADVDAKSFVRHEKNWYDASILSMDGEIEHLLEQIDALGLGDRTTFAFVSDHGEEFLEHGRHWHGTTVYGELTNVPMLLWGAGVPSGRVVEQTVETLDLYPTLLEIAGISPPERLQGESLVPLFEGAAASTRPTPAFTQLPDDGRPGTWPMYAVIEGPWKLVWNEDAPEDVPELELYDHENDPLNLVNVASENPDIVASLGERVKNWRSWAVEQRLDEEAFESQMSAEELEQLRALGYVE